MKLQDVLSKTTQFFKDKNFDSPRLEAELLLSHGLGMSRVQLYMKFDRPMSEPELEKCRALVKRRIQGEPSAYILGQKDFYGIKFNVSPATLIPRPETEEAIEFILKWLHKQELPQAQILDLGTGSGCAGLSILVKEPDTKLWTVDISAEAVEVAQQNAEALGIKDRVQFCTADAVTALADAPDADVIFANPPYIDNEDPEVQNTVRQFEPHLALFAKDQGLALLKSWSSAAVSKLKTPGIMIFEMGYQQGPQMKEHFLGLSQFKEVRVLKDLSGHDRFIIGEK